MATNAYVVDLRPVLDEVQSKLADLTEGAMDLDTVLTLATHYVNDQNDIEEGLDAMASQIEESAYESLGEPCQDDIDIVVDAATTVGRYLHDTFTLMGVYDEDGSLGTMGFDRLRGLRGTDAIFVKETDD